MAKKSREFRELLHQESSEKNAMAQAKREFEKTAVQAGATGVRFAQPQSEKMSDVLEDFIEPFVEDGELSLEANRVLLTMAVVAWNVANMPEDQQESALQDFLKVFSPTLGKGLLEAETLIRQMIVRKQRFFAKNQRFILNFQLKDLGHSRHLSVASTLPK
jgi:hypothetical protein